MFKARKPRIAKTKAVIERPISQEEKLIARFITKMFRVKVFKPKTAKKEPEFKPLVVGLNLAKFGIIRKVKMTTKPKRVVAIQQEPVIADLPVKPIIQLEEVKPESKHESDNSTTDS